MLISWAGKVQLLLDLYAVTEETGTAYWELEMSMVPSHFLDHDPLEDPDLLSVHCSDLRVMIRGQLAALHRRFLQPWLPTGKFFLWAESQPVFWGCHGGLSLAQPLAMPRQPILSQEEKEARARERDRLKKQRRREDGLRRSLERQRNALAMRRRRWEKREARRRMCQEAELLACRLGGEAWEWRPQRREEQAKAPDRDLAAMVQLRQEERTEPRPSLIWVLA